ncbi:MAG: hypothetical protein ACR2GV_03830 [Gaiellaceae bacterium]
MRTVSATASRSPGVERPAVFRTVLEEDFPVFCSHIIPEDSTWRWELEATPVR